MVWDLFTNTIEASSVLGVDADHRARLVELKSKLLLPKIGKWGQLQEIRSRSLEQSFFQRIHELRGLHDGTTETWFPRLSDSSTA